MPNPPASRDRGHLWSPPPVRSDTTRPRLGPRAPRPPASPELGAPLVASPVARRHHTTPTWRRAPDAQPTGIPRSGSPLVVSPGTRRHHTTPTWRRAPDAQPTGIPRSGAPLVASQGTRRHPATPSQTTGPGALGIPANGGHLRSPPRPRGDPTRPRVTGIPPHPPAPRNQGSPLVASQGTTRHHATPTWVKQRRDERRRGGCRPASTPPESLRDYSAAMISRIRSAVSDGVLPTLTPAASRASFLACAVPAEPETMAPAWPMVLPSGAVKPAT